MCSKASRGRRVTEGTVSPAAAQAQAATNSSDPEGRQITEPAPSDAPEQAVVRDMLPRCALVGAPLVVLGLVGWGWSGIASVGLALGLVVLNFLLGAAAITWGARIGGSALVGTVLGGYIVRLGIVTAVVLPIRSFGWFEVAPFALALLVTHVAVLVWETRHVAASLAFPGLKPKPGPTPELSTSDRARGSHPPMSN